MGRVSAGGAAAAAPSAALVWRKVRRRIPEMVARGGRRAGETAGPKIKMAPIPRGRLHEPYTFKALAGPRLLLLLFGRCFFLRCSLLGCVLHRLILPNIKFAIVRSQCDSYIRWCEVKVKKKMHFRLSGGTR